MYQRTETCADISQNGLLGIIILVGGQTILKFLIETVCLNLVKNISKTNYVRAF